MFDIKQKTNIVNIHLPCSCFRHHSLALFLFPALFTCRVLVSSTIRLPCFSFQHYLLAMFLFPALFAWGVHVSGTIHLLCSCFWHYSLAVFLFPALSSWSVFMYCFQATSKLLPGYPQELRDEILDYLFKVRKFEIIIVSQIYIFTAYLFITKTT